MQGGDLGVRTGIGKVDRVPDTVAAQRLTGIEVPTEKRIDHHGHIATGAVPRPQSENRRPSGSGHAGGASGRN